MPTISSSGLSTKAPSPRSSRTSTRTINERGAARLAIAGALSVAGIGVILWVWLRPGPDSSAVVAASSAQAETTGASATPAGATVGVPDARSPGVAAEADPQAEAKAKLKTLDEVLAAKNDNDPRLDVAFRGLSPAAKRLFRSRYDALAPEKLNERGTVVFLLGREIKSREDVAFLARVATEPPCLSLGDCGRAQGADPHTESINGVTLAYPKIVALKALERWLASPQRDPELQSAVIAALRGARGSLTPRVARLAEEILRQAGEG